MINVYTGLSICLFFGGVRNVIKIMILGGNRLILRLENQESQINSCQTIGQFSGSGQGLLPRLGLRLIGQRQYRDSQGFLTRVIG